MTRLEELHKAYEDMQEQYIPEWTPCCEIYPHNSRIVNIQIWENGGEVKKYGIPARCLNWYGKMTWFTPTLAPIEGWVTFWKDFDVK